MTCRLPLAAYHLFLVSFGIFAVFVLSGCAAHKLDWIQTGPQFPPRDYTDVPVYETKAQTRRAWGAVGIIHGPHTPASDRRGIERQIEQARKLAASHGADAVIMVEEPVVEGIFHAQFAGGAGRPMVYLSGVAIRYAVGASTGTTVLPRGVRGKGGR